jgi:hypothetical protein
MLSDLADRIYWFGCIVAGGILAIGVADYWFVHDELFVFFRWMALAAIPWAIGSAIRYILTGRW